MAGQAVLRQSDSSSVIQPPTPNEVLRYRYHHGTNLGSIYVLEKWLSGSMFVEGSTGESELDAVNASLRRDGLDATRQKWEAHWRDAVSEGDWNWLVNAAKCTTIRLPIGYFTLGPAFCNGTPFEGQPAQVYTNAWNSVRAFVGQARSHGIGVLLDFHALPGGANGEIHSGTSSGRAELWGNGRNLDHARDCLVFIAREGRNMDGVIGVQLCNEAVWEANGMYGWYDSVIGAISGVDPSMPIYISDAWNLTTAIEYCQRKNPATSASNPIVVDTHKYYTFDEASKNQSPQQIIGRVGGELGELDGRSGSVQDRGAAQVIVGEYSCVLDGRTWAQVSEAQRPELIQQFGRVQSQRWQERAGGSFFWTYKMDWMDGGEWGFAQQTKSSNILPPSNLRMSSADVNARIGQAEGRRNELHDSAVSQHEKYWSMTSPGQNFEHWRFDQGWNVGFSDAQVFFASRVRGGLVGEGGDKIGMLDVWVRKRIAESGQGGGFVWEFEQGVRKGVADFYGVVGI
ncbi:MAG: Glucan 1,3-beta-glucosidase 3 [Caeruleum heppii]|nr:MAG: Glucan 1,3-beta-glucosidase 3 [Caeruleum heppii]